MTAEDTKQAPQSGKVAPAVGARNRGETVAGDPAAPLPGAPTVNWRKAIRDDGLRKHADRFASLDDLIQGNINLRKRLSSGAVVPGDDASEAERAEFRRRIGVPERSPGYAVTPPPGVPVALLPTEENGGIARQAKFLDVFHRHNLTPATATARRSPPRSTSCRPRRPVPWRPATPPAPRTSNAAKPPSTTSSTAAARWSAPGDGWFRGRKHTRSRRSRFDRDQAASASRGRSSLMLR